MGAGLGAAASIGGSLFGALGGNNTSNTADTGAMNALLQNALTSGLNYSQGYTNQAIGAENTGLNEALQSLQQAGSVLSSYGQQALNASTTGFNQSQALNEPIRTAGYNALDSYEDSLGLARPKVGNAAMAQALTNDATSQGMLNTLQTQNGTLNSLYNASSNPFEPAGASAAWNNQYGAPIAPTAGLLANAVTPQQALQYAQQNSTYNPQTGMYTYTGAGSQNGYAAMSGTGVGDTVANLNQISSYYNGGGTLGQAPAGAYPLQQNPDGSYTYANSQGLGPGGPEQNQMDLAVAQGMMPGALTDYNAANSTYSQLGTQLNNYTPAQQQLAIAYNRGLFTAPTSRSNLY